jgi:hypothetical protein
MQAIERFISPDLPLTLMSSDICAVLASMGMTGIDSGVTYSAILKKCQEMMRTIQGHDETTPKLKRRRVSVAKPTMRPRPAGYVLFSQNIYGRASGLR